MKRKVMKSGPSTLVVSLPSKWAKSFNVKSGSEVDIVEEGDRLLVYSNGEQKTESRSLEARDGSLLFRRALSALYKAGYDEVRIKYKTAKELEYIYLCLEGGYIGLEPFEDKKNVIVVKKVSDIDFSQFNIMLRKTFFYLLNMGEESVAALEERNNDLLKRVILKDKSVNKFANFCRRAINKKIIKEFKKNAPLYYIVDQLETLGDCYKDLGRELIETKRTSQNFIDLFSEFNDYFRDFYNLFYEFDGNKFEKFTRRRDILVKKIKDHKTQNMILYCHLFGMIDLVDNMGGPLLLMNV